MRVIGVTIAAAVFAAFGSTGDAASTSDSASKRPTLRFVDLEPMTVRGQNFKAGERVKLLVSARGIKRMAAKANAQGQFTAKLAVKADRCTAVVVQAFGDRGSRAMVDITTPDCASIDRIDP